MVLCFQWILLINIGINLLNIAAAGDEDDLFDELWQNDRDLVTATSFEAQHKIGPKLKIDKLFQNHCQPKKEPKHEPEAAKEGQTVLAQCQRRVPQHKAVKKEESQFIMDLNANAVAFSGDQRPKKEPINTLQELINNQKEDDSIDMEEQSNSEFNSDSDEKQFDAYKTPKNSNIAKNSEIDFTGSEDDDNGEEMSFSSPEDEKPIKSKLRKTHTDEEKKTLLKRYNEMKAKKVNNNKIAAKLGISTATLTLWLREMRTGTKKQIPDKQKMKKNVVIEFIKMRDQYLLNNPNKSRREADHEIAKHFGVKRSTIYMWKQSLGIAKPQKMYGKEEKQLILSKYEQLKRSKLLAKNSSKLSIKQINERIEQKLGVSLQTIYSWKSRKDQKSRFNEEDRLSLMDKYFQLREANPNFNDLHIAKNFLKISPIALSAWKRIYKKCGTMAKRQTDEEAKWNWNGMKKKRM